MNKNIDKLENFILENKEQFNTRRTPDYLWERIESQLDKKKKKFGFARYLKYAAVLFTVLVSGFLIGNKVNQTSGLNYASLNNASEYQTAEHYLMQQVNHKFQELDQKKLLDDQVKLDLKALDDVYIDLQKELLGSNYENSDIIIKAMIQNYRTKIKILEKILEKKSIEDNFDKILNNENNEII